MRNRIVYKAISIVAMLLVANSSVVVAAGDLDATKALLCAATSTAVCAQHDDCVS